MPARAGDKFTVGLETAVLSTYFKTLEILDAPGRAIKHIKILDSETLIEIITEDLSDGIYLLRLMDDKKERVVLRKLAVQH